MGWESWQEMGGKGPGGRPGKVLGKDKTATQKMNKDAFFTRVTGPLISVGRCLENFCLFVL